MSDVTIEVKEDGPFLVKGSVNIVDSEGNAFDADKPAIALCRCGASEDNPFCNGTHRQIGFKSAPKAG